VSLKPVPASTAPAAPTPGAAGAAIAPEGTGVAEGIEIAYCRIHPGLGIARIGNSPEEFFIGPEAPGEVVEPVGGYKDAEGRIKRQAARFRIYAYDKQDRPICELTAAEANITWTVHLANRKAACNMFLGAYWQSQYPDLHSRDALATPLRNQQIPAGSAERALLVIDPGPRSIGGVDETRRVRFDGGTIGPLPYTELAPHGTRKPDSLRGSRSGYMNVPLKELAPPPPGIGSWQPGVLQQPVAMSAKREVPLGELRTDAAGRLLVLGGAGKSGSLIPQNPIGFLNEDSSYCNNDYWYDDVSDGPVSATVALLDGTSIEVRDGAWVLAAVPKYVPAAETLTTLYQIACEAVEAARPDDPVSFVEDVYPFLKKLDMYSWLNKTANRGHGTDSAQGSFVGHDNPVFQALRSNGEEGGEARRHVFGRLRPPGLVAPDAAAKDTTEALLFANAKWMPQMNGDGGRATNLAEAPIAPPGGTYITWLTLTPVQYAKMKRWADGDFAADWPHDGRLPSPGPLGRYPVAQQPAALDRAALEPCVGGAFYPGIEMTYISRERATWSGLCRINPALGPGGVTQHMALPWQADFSECNTAWWPAQRPDDVVSEEAMAQALKSYDSQTRSPPLSTVLATRVPWARGLALKPPQIDIDMVEHWHDLGFVVRKHVAGQDVMVETERSPYVGRELRDYFYYLMNISAYGDFLPRAHRLVHEMLAEAWRNQNEADPDEVWKFFHYTQESFDARLDLIYNNFVRDASLASAEQQTIALKQALEDAAAQGYLARSREQVVESLLQMAPFNQLDGAWLRGITPDGPVGTIDAMLFSIRMDEMGDGNVAQNHANVYTDLLKSLNIYLPDLHTREYADNLRLKDAAFVQPVFLLAISQFGDEFMPELLGMTLYLEWSAIGLLTTVDQMNAFGINPLYYSLHVGIDNASAGHGAIAKSCVAMYLDRVRESEGEDAMQRVWRRVWNGYVAFGTLGTLGEEMFYGKPAAPTPEDLVVQMIRRKAPYASRAHREKMLGPNLINDWMLDPLGLLGAMQNAGLVIPGDLEHSAIFQLIGFNGPMFHVFTADEQTLWQDYVLYLGKRDDKPVKKSNYALMHTTLDFMRQRQSGVAGHDVMLQGPYPGAHGPIVSKSISAWFALNDNVALLRALAHPGNGWVKKGDPLGSPLVTSMLAGSGAMAKALQAPAPGAAGQSYKNIIVEWIGLGCAVPHDELVALAAVAAADGPPDGLTAHGAVGMQLPPMSAYVSPAKDGRRRRIWGMGTPH
jgi:hypothetical protein